MTTLTEMTDWLKEINNDYSKKEEIKMRKAIVVNTKTGKTILSKSCGDLYDAEILIIDAIGYDSNDLHLHFDNGAWVRNVGNFNCKVITQ
jgi:hypothetical protein